MFQSSSKPKPKGIFLIVESDPARVEFLKAVLQASGHKASLACRPLTRSESEATQIIASLTPREKSIFDRLIDGKSNKVTARELGLSPRTVEFYRARIMFKTKAASVPDLVKIALAAWS